MSIRWQFVEGYEADASHWSWRVIRLDGTLEAHSQTFSTYGLAVSDAIRNGFQPRLQHWIVATRHTVTHFQPGKPPITVPADDKSPAALPKGRSRNIPEPGPDPEAGAKLSRHRSDTQ